MYFRLRAVRKWFRGDRELTFERGIGTNAEGKTTGFLFLPVGSVVVLWCYFPAVFTLGTVYSGVAFLFIPGDIVQH